MPSSRGGRPVVPQTIGRWISSGVAAPDGRRVRLEARRLGGRWVTSREALERFMAALTPGLDDEAVVETPARRRQEREYAARVLDAAGI